LQKFLSELGIGQLEKQEELLKPKRDFKKGLMQKTFNWKG